MAMVHNMYVNVISTTRSGVARARVIFRRHEKRLLRARAREFRTHQARCIRHKY